MLSNHLGKMLTSTTWEFKFCSKSPLKRIYSSSLGASLITDSKDGGGGTHQCVCSLTTKKKWASYGVPAFQRTRANSSRVLRRNVISASVPCIWLSVFLYILNRTWKNHYGVHVSKHNKATILTLCINALFSCVKAEDEKQKLKCKLSGSSALLFFANRPTPPRQIKTQPLVRFLHAAI